MRPTTRWAAVGFSALALVAGVLAAAVPASAATLQPAAATTPQLHVSGNQLVTQTGSRVVLHGADRSGGEFACVQGNGFWDGPMDQTSINAMLSWGITAVRVPLNEACWNGESYVNPAFAGTNYHNAVKAYVSLLNANGIVAILDLHWTDGLYTGNSSGCASAQATCQKPMPDSAQAIPFWTSVATTFKGNNAVIFDLFNEPFPDRATGNETTAWQCWRNGGTCTGIGYQVAGMQSMVNAVRGTGASNVLMLGGLAFSNDLTQWTQFKPTDPDNNLVASWHSYNFNTCSTTACWTSQIAPVIASAPLIAGEIGENDCADGYINGVMSFLDSHQTSYLGWTWNAWNCNTGPSLISDYSGTPTAFGSGYKSHLLALKGGAPAGGGGAGEVHAVGAGKCMDVTGASHTQGTLVDSWACSGNSNQVWTHTSARQFTVYGGADCLDAINNGTVAGTKVQIWPCNSGANQQWNVNANGTITGVQSGLCLDVTGASTANGAGLELWTCTGASNQQWTLG
jgi:Cellulase (glycosyl hydrolase family 5)/Ricin-type beta-trefoil lectin domain